MSEIRTFTTTIGRPADIVYGYVSEIDNLAQWASAFGPYVKRIGDATAAAATADGPVTIAFAPLNEFGVVDHWITTETGARTYVPMRVLRLGDGAAIMLTLLQGAMSAERFREDCEWVERDLAKLKAILEA